MNNLKYFTNQQRKQVNEESIIKEINVIDLFLQTDSYIAYEKVELIVVEEELKKIINDKSK